MQPASDRSLDYAAYHPQVLGYLTRMLGHRETAQDLAQETFLRAAKAGGPEDESHKRAWIFRIARNVALNHLRDTTRHLRLAGDAPRTDTGATQETSLLVREALAQLAPLDRDIFLLRESAGLDYQDIAETCGMTADAVRSRLQRARQALRVLLAGTLAASRARGVRLTGKE
jgi:RNA polymerase sigma-70 factor, ECF subfamily